MVSLLENSEAKSDGRVELHPAFTQPRKTRYGHNRNVVAVVGEGVLVVILVVVVAQTCNPTY